ncbi:MAG TPA: ABC transporter substrate-binding protein, partial [Candidatus Limnocylindria bacterium]|nr:ABC transporter substrate-binding protein [Candidatus Limnocylindria bacterium]
MGRRHAPRGRPAPVLRALIRALAALLALVLVPGCAPVPAPPRDLVVGLVGEPPALLSDHPSALVLAPAVTEGLVVRDARDELAPRLVVEIPTLENGGLRLVYEGDEAGHLVATVRIRSDARWHDGRPVTAGDVRFAHEEGRALAATAEASALARRIDRVVVVSDEIAHLVGRPGERWHDLVLAARVLPRHVLGGAGPEAVAAYARAPMHAGPYVVSSWTAGGGLTL